MIRSPLAAAVCVVALSGCSGPDEQATPGSEAPTWTLSEVPTLQVGVVDGAAEYLLHQVVSSVTLPNGNVAALNAGSHELRIYDPSGRFVTRAGRQGEGPGEFRKPLRLYLIGDTLAVFDDGANRLSYHDLDGSFVGTSPIEREQGRLLWDEWLYDRSWIDGPTMGRGKGTVASALARLPPPDTLQGYRYVRVSDFGHLWVRQEPRSENGQSHWQVYDLAGSLIGRVALPAGFEIHSIGRDYLLGRSHDSLGVEYLQRYALDTNGFVTEPVSFGSDTRMQLSSGDSLAVRDLRGALRMLTGAQELYYSDPANSYTYADDYRKLKQYEPPKGVEIRIVTATPAGWRAVAIHRASKTMCGMAIGPTPPVGWSSGMAMCL